MEKVERDDLNKLTRWGLCNHRWMITSSITKENCGNNLDAFDQKKETEYGLHCLVVETATDYGQKSGLFKFFPYGNLC